MKIAEPITKKFYDGLEEGKLIGRKCTRCGAIEFPPVLVCNTCSCTDMEWYEMSGKAELTHFTYVGVYTRRMPEVVAEYGEFSQGAIKTEEGVEFNACVLGITPENADELYAKLPIPVRPKIIQRDGFKTLFYELI